MDVTGGVYPYEYQYKKDHLCHKREAQLVSLQVEKGRKKDWRPQSVLAMLRMD